MSREVRQFTALIPAGTPASKPALIDMTMPPRVVSTLEVIVPPGPSGYVGFAIAQSGLRVIPYQSDLWIVTSDEKIVWPMDGYTNSGSWQLIGYNTGAQDHAVYVRFLCDVPQVLSAIRPAIPTDVLTSDY